MLCVAHTRVTIQLALTLFSTKKSRDKFGISFVTYKLYQPVLPRYHMWPAISCSSVCPETCI